MMGKCKTSRCYRDSFEMFALCAYSVQGTAHTISFEIQWNDFIDFVFRLLAKLDQRIAVRSVFSESNCQAAGLH